MVCGGGGGESVVVGSAGAVVGAGAWETDAGAEALSELLGVLGGGGFPAEPSTGMNGLIEIPMLQVVPGATGMVTDHFPPEIHWAKVLPSMQL